MNRPRFLLNVRCQTSAICKFITGRLARGLWVILLALTFGKANSQGVFVYKSQNFHSDGLAKALRYDNLEADGLATWVTLGGERLRFEKQQFHTWAELPAALPARLITPAEQAWLSAQIASVQAISRFPTAAGMVQPTLKMLTEAAQMIKEGMVRENGQWLKREESDAAMARREAARIEALAEEEHRDRMRAEAEERQRKEALAEQVAAHKREQERREALREARIAVIESDIADLEKMIQGAREKNQRLGVRLSNLLGSNED